MTDITDAPVRKRSGRKPQGFGQMRVTKLPIAVDRALEDMVDSTGKTFSQIIRDAVVKELMGATQVQQAA
jgi:hypothetical protein